MDGIRGHFRRSKKSFRKSLDFEVLHFKNISKISEKLKIFSFIFRSASAIDELMVNFEGEMYPLREVADVSKKDPKRVIIDTSAIPQVTN